MMITEEMIAEDEKRWNDRNIVAELGYCGKNICHRKNITNDDIRFYAYIMRQAHALLKEQEAENGEWITIWQEDDPDTSTHARCSICNRISGRPLGGYCKWCGAKMNQEWGVDG